jgi:hypothetical protein
LTCSEVNLHGGLSAALSGRWTLSEGSEEIMRRSRMGARRTTRRKLNFVLTVPDARLVLSSCTQTSTWLRRILASGTSRNVQVKHGRTVKPP